MADIMDLFDQETAAPAVAVNPADAEREARLKQMLGMRPADFEEAAYKRFWKKQYGVDEKSSGIKRFLAGLAEGGSKLAQGKDRPLVMDRARKEGLEDYTAAQRTGLGELKLLDAEQKQQQNLSSANHWKGKAFDANLVKLAMQMQAQGVSEELTRAKIGQIALQNGKTQAQTDQILAGIDFTKKKTDLLGLSPESQNIISLGKRPDGEQIRQTALSDIFGRQAMKSGAQQLFPNRSDGIQGQESWREVIVPNDLTGPSLRLLKSGRGSSGGGAPQQNPQDVLQILRQINPAIPGSPAAPAGQTQAAQAPAISNVMQLLRQGGQPAAAPAARPQAGPARPTTSLPQVMSTARSKQWSAKVPWLKDAYTEKMDGFSPEEWEPPAAFANNIGVPPKSYTDPRRAAARQAAAGFRNLATTAVNAFVNDELKDVAGPMNQFMLGVRRYGEARPDVAISTDVLSKQTLADLVRSISGLTVSDKEQARLDNLVGSASKSPAEFMKLSLYTNMLQQRHDFAESLMLPEDMKAFVVSDPQVTEELDNLWRSVVTLAENMQKAKREGRNTVKINGQEMPVKTAKAALDLDKMTRKTILKSVYRRFPNSDYLPQKIGAR